jgi:hypothetical protein
MACRLFSLPGQKQVLRHFTFLRVSWPISTLVPETGTHRAHLVQRFIRLFNISDKHSHLRNRLLRTGVGTRVHAGPALTRPTDLLLVFGIPYNMTAYRAQDIIANPHPTLGESEPPGNLSPVGSLVLAQ